MTKQLKALLEEHDKAVQERRKWEEEVNRLHRDKLVKIGEEETLMVKVVRECFPELVRFANVHGLYVSDVLSGQVMNHHGDSFEITLCVMGEDDEWERAVLLFIAEGDFQFQFIGDYKNDNNLEMCVDHFKGDLNHMLDEHRKAYENG